MFLANMNLATVSSSMEGDEPGSQTGVFKYAGRVVATKQSLLVTVEWDSRTEALSRCVLLRAQHRVALRNPF